MEILRVCGASRRGRGDGLKVLIDIGGAGVALQSHVETQEHVVFMKP